MKREIICPKCQSSLLGKLGEYPGEGHKFVAGKSRIDCLCDHCITPIKPGDNCWALSIWTNRNPYYAWESEFLDQRGSIAGTVFLLIWTAFLAFHVAAFLTRHNLSALKIALETIGLK